MNDNIKSLSAKDASMLVPLANLFAQESEFLDVAPDHFVKTMGSILESEIGCCFICRDGERTRGMIAGIKHPDFATGRMVATELFWFVHPECRSKMLGPRLLKAFENWAKEQKCSRIIMVHMIDLMPEKIKRFYLKRGYRLAELHYIKEG